MPGLQDRALEILQLNWTGTATLPSRDQYPHQWSWDSAFISIGLARVDPARARTELCSLFQSQWVSGRIPQIVFNEEAEGYFPGPSFWGSHAASGMATSGLVQPPIHARAVLTVHQADPVGSAALGFLDRLYPQLQAWHTYLFECRDAGGGGLAAIVHPWESGLDNSPAWDFVLRAMEQGDAGFERRDTEHVDASHRPTDADYRAYVDLAARYRDRGCADSALDQHPFVVEDPLFNALLLDAELCLSRIAELVGVDPEPHVQRARRVHDALLARLWNADGRHFAARDVHSGTLSQVATVGSLMPLLDPWLPAETRDEVVGLATSAAFADGCEYPLPSTARTAPEFDRRRYWRGPTWINTNWLVWVAAREVGASELAGRLSAATLRLVKAAGFREYFDPVSGEGLGAHDFSWTAALTLDLLAAEAADRKPCGEGAR